MDTRAIVKTQKQSKLLKRTTHIFHHRNGRENVIHKDETTARGWGCTTGILLMSGAPRIWLSQSSRCIQDIGHCARVGVVSIDDDHVAAQQPPLLDAGKHRWERYGRVPKGDADAVLSKYSLEPREGGPAQAAARSQYADEAMVSELLAQGTLALHTWLHHGCRGRSCEP